MCPAVVRGTKDLGEADLKPSRRRKGQAPAPRRQAGSVKRGGVLCTCKTRREPEAHWDRSARRRMHAHTTAHLSSNMAHAPRLQSGTRVLYTARVPFRLMTARAEAHAFSSLPNGPRYFWVSQSFAKAAAHLLLPSLPDPAAAGLASLQIAPHSFHGRDKVHAAHFCSFLDLQWRKLRLGRVGPVKVPAWQTMCALPKGQILCMQQPRCGIAPRLSHSSRHVFTTLEQVHGRALCHDTLCTACRWQECVWQCACRNSAHLYTVCSPGPSAPPG